MDNITWEERMELMDPTVKVKAFNLTGLKNSITKSVADNCEKLSYKDGYKDAMEFAARLLVIWLGDGITEAEKKLAIADLNKKPVIIVTAELEADHA